MDLRQYALQQEPATPPAPPPPLRLAREQAQEAREGLSSAQVYKEYQEAIKRTGWAREAITKGILRGSNPYKLLLLAADCIGRITGDASFVETTKRDLALIYGDVLEERGALELELEEVENRLERLRAYRGPDEYRVQASIREHEKQAADLRSKIQK